MLLQPMLSWIRLLQAPCLPTIKYFLGLRTKADLSLELILSSIRHRDEMPQEFLQRPRPAAGHSGVTVELQQEAVAWTSGSMTSPRETVPTYSSEPVPTEQSGDAGRG